MESEIPHPVHANQGDARLRLLRALLRRRTLQELIRSNPKLALSLHAARARLMLQGANAVTISLAPVEASVTSDTPAAAISEGTNEHAQGGWDAAVKAACQPPKPQSWPTGPVEDAMLHQLGVLELLVQHSALLLRLTARMAAAAAAAAAQQAPPKQDSHSSDAAETVCLADDAASQCCRSGRCKRACLSADGGSKIDSQPAAKKACHRPASQIAQPLACTPTASAVRGIERPMTGDSCDSTGSSGAIQASGAEPSCTESESESEPINDFDADLEDDAASSCS